MVSTRSDISLDRVKAAIRAIPDFPKPGILFRDITTVLLDPELFRQVIDAFCQPLRDQDIRYVVGIESRGFILGAPLAYALGAGFVPIRKTGKLPGLVERHEYDLEYGSDIVEIHKDAIPPGDKVVLVDDLLATGGTAAASATLLKRLNVNLVALLFLIELADLQGRNKLPADIPAHVLIQF